jgi:hypothetical protein
MRSAIAIRNPFAVGHWVFRSMGNGNGPLEIGDWSSPLAAPQYTGVKTWRRSKKFGTYWPSPHKKEKKVAPRLLPLYNGYIVWPCVLDAQADFGRSRSARGVWYWGGVKIIMPRMAAHDPLGP